MSDCNVLIKEVDSAMDMLEAFIKDIDNAFAYASFDIASVTALAGKNVDFFRHKAAESCSVSSAPYSSQEISFVNSSRLNPPATNTAQSLRSSYAICAAAQRSLQKPPFMKWGCT